MKKIIIKKEDYNFKRFHIYIFIIIIREKERENNKYQI
jgi:hypothetical protein